MKNQLDTKVEKLFRLFKEKLHTPGSSIKIIEAIKSDEELIEASNSYCVQCGFCCKEHCQNKETRSDGLVYCLLHDQFGKTYPHGKKIPSEREIITKRLNPKEWTKPNVCHTYGPHLAFIALVFYKTQEINLRMAQKTEMEYPCAKNMLEDYVSFLKTSK